MVGARMNNGVIRDLSPQGSDSSLHSDGYDSDDTHSCMGSVIDIGGSRLCDAMRDELETKFLWKHGQYQQNRLIPASVLHDDIGLKMWKELNCLPNYYQTRDEIELLEENSEDLAEHLTDAWTLIDLGCGDIRKIKPLLDRLEYMRVPVQYFALDLSRETLVECMRKLKPHYRYVHCFGLWGNFEDGLEWVKTIQSPKCIISLGSMFGNDHFDEAVARLKTWADVMRPEDRMLLGLDACQDKDVIWKSYHDDDGLFDDFVRNGLVHSNAVLGHDWYRPGEWKISGEFQAVPLMHHFAITALRDVKCEPLGISFPTGQKLVCYEGFKYEPRKMHKQFAAAGLKSKQTWKSPSGRIYQYLLSRSAIVGHDLGRRSA